MSETQRRLSRVEKCDIKSQSSETSNPVKTKILKNQSLDQNIESSKQNATNPGASLSIPEQNVRRHSIGTSAVASASIVQRLQQIAAESADPKSESDKKPAGIGVLNSNKSFGAHGPGHANAGRGRAHPMMGRGINPSGRPIGPNGSSFIQNKRTSNPDLATVYPGMKEKMSSLKPLENQMAARRFSSDMRIADFGHLRGGNVNQTTIENTQPFSQRMRGNTGELKCYFLKKLH